MAFCSREMADSAYDGETACGQCARSGGLRPDVVWFGEIPYHMDEIGERLSGCDLFLAVGTSGVVYPAAEVAEPGVVKHIEGNRFSLGEPDGEKSDRAVALSKALTAAGLKAPVRPRLRDEIWVKLWGNLSFNPISFFP